MSPNHCVVALLTYALALCTPLVSQGEVGESRLDHVDRGDPHAERSGVLDHRSADPARGARDHRHLACGITERHQSSGKRNSWGYGKKFGRSPALWRSFISCQNSTVEISGWTSSNTSPTIRGERR